MAEIVTERLADFDYKWWGGLYFDVRRNVHSGIQYRNLQNELPCCKLVPMNGRIIQLIAVVLLLISWGFQSRVEKGEEADLSAAQTPRSAGFQGVREYREMVAAKEMRIEEKRAELEKLRREVPALQNRSMWLTAKLKETPQDKNLLTEVATVAAQVIRLQSSIDRARSELWAAQEALASAELEFTPIPQDLLTNPKPSYLF